MAHEMDLIPASYRERLKIQHWCQLFIIVFVCICLLIVLSRFSISHNIEKIEVIIKNLQKDKSFNLQQQKKYNELFLAKKDLQKNLEILSGLRGGPSVKQMFKVIDRVMDGSVWFNDWVFHRAGEITDVKPQTQQSGYFIIIPQESNQSDKQQAWKLNTHMEINGSAKDHTGFSHFVSQLINQPEIEDVKVINTLLSNNTIYQMINFKIIVIVNNQFKLNHV